MILIPSRDEHYSLPAMQDSIPEQIKKVAKSHENTVLRFHAILPFFWPLQEQCYCFVWQNFRLRFFAISRDNFALVVWNEEWELNYAIYNNC